jgi:Stress responsive A/B Barrel Domain
MVDDMIRHVVTFTWEPTAGGERVAAALTALRGLRQEVGGMSFLVVAEDAGLSDGNASAVLIADFADAQAFYRYAQDPVHLSVVAEFVRPILASRAAVQYQV